jgi:hypothetical protein
MSLTYFPRVYPNELLFSVIARWRGHLGWPSPSQTAEVLFGKRGRVRAIVDIPGQIDELIKKLPVQLGHSASSLIMRHTLFPYVTAFLEEDRRLKVGRQMRIVSGKPHQHLGPRIPGIDFVTHLRFCSECATEMNNVYGETYWVRDHQLPSSLVCHLHGNMLVAGCAIPTAGRPAYIPAPSPLEMPNYAESEPNQKTSDALLTLANLGTRVLTENRPILAAEVKNRSHKSTNATQSQVLSQFKQFIFPAFQAVNVKLDEDALAAAFNPKMTAVPALYYLIASSLSDSNV